MSKNYPSLMTFLEGRDPTTAKGLRNRHGDVGELFTTTRELGETATAPDVIDPKRRAALIDLLVSTISKMKLALLDLAAFVRRKMRLVTRVKFAGAVIATVSGGLGAVFSYMEFGDKTTAMIISVLSLCGGLAAIFSDELQKAPSGIKIGSVEEYTKIVEMLKEVELIERRIERDPVFSIPDGELHNLLTKLDRFALEITRLSLA
jgi:hypothetical protein